MVSNGIKSLWIHLVFAQLTYFDPMDRLGQKIEIGDKKLEILVLRPIFDTNLENFSFLPISPHWLVVDICS